MVFPEGGIVNEENKEGYEEKLTADDFVFAFRRALKKSTGAKDAECLLAIKNASEVLEGKMSSKKLGVKKLSDRKLKIVLSYPDGDFLKTLTRAICMPCNESFFNLTKGRYGLSLQYIIGNGPFYMGSWNTDKSVTIKKNPYYHGKNTAVPQSVMFSINNELSTRAKKLTAGTYDVSPLDYDGYSQVMGEKGFTFIESKNKVWSLVFNCDDEYMKDMNARLAVRGVADDCDVAFRVQQGREPHAENRMVVDDEDCDLVHPKGIISRAWVRWHPHDGGGQRTLSMNATM